MNINDKKTNSLGIEAVDANTFVNELLNADKTEVKEISDLLNSYIDNRLNDFKNKNIMKTKIGRVISYDNDTNIAKVEYPEDLETNKIFGSYYSNFTIPNQSVFKKLQSGDEVLILKTLDDNYLIIGCTQSTALKRNSLDELYEENIKIKEQIKYLEKQIEGLKDIIKSLSEPKIQ